MNVLLRPEENVIDSTHVIYDLYYFSEVLRNKIWTKNKDLGNFRLTIIK